jgi:hypothetical protein
MSRPFEHVAGGRQVPVKVLYRDGVSVVEQEEVTPRSVSPLYDDLKVLISPAPTPKNRSLNAPEETEEEFRKRKEYLEQRGNEVAASFPIDLSEGGNKATRWINPLRGENGEPPELVSTPLSNEIGGEGGRSGEDRDMLSRSPGSSPQSTELVRCGWWNWLTGGWKRM